MTAGVDPVALGAWLSLDEPVLAEIAARAGYAWVCIDLQHGLAAEARLPELLQAVAANGSLPVVRVEENHPARIGRALDAGAMAVIVPMIESAADAARAVAACRYPPAGRRSFGPVVAQLRAVEPTAVRCIPLIETAAGLDEVERIAAVPGVSGLYVGPVDLGLSLGLGAAMDHDHPRFGAALDRVVAACRTAGVAAGIHADATLAARRVATGFTFVNVGLDLASVRRALVTDLATVRAALAAQPGAAGTVATAIPREDPCPPS